MRKITLLLLIIGAIPIYGQNSSKITGFVKDPKSALEFVTITLAKSADSTKIVNYTTSDSTGAFEFHNIAYGQYQLKLSFIGYNSAFKNIVVSSNNLQLGTVLLTENITQLQGVNVVAQKKIIEKTTEGFIVNAASSITQAGGTATDILKNTPTISVDAEGGITLRGKTPLILINGRNSNLANPDNIPASSIESIEIINSATAKYDANAESGIINIKLKKAKENGTNGAYALGVGAGAKGRFNSSFLLNHKTKKWNVGLSYDNRFAGRTRKISSNRTNFFVPDAYFLNQSRNDNRIERLQNLKLDIDFSPDENNTFSFEAIGSNEGQDNLESLNTVLYKQASIFKSNTNRHSDEFGREKVAEFAVDYSRKFKDKNKNLTANITTSTNWGKENTDITSQSLTENLSSFGNPTLERTHNYENGNIMNAKVDYSFSVSDKAVLETGFRGTYRTIKADYETAKSVNGTYLINTAASNIFHFNENVQALYLLYNAKMANDDQWKYNIGIRAEQVANNGNTENNSTKFTNDYLKFFPTASLTFNKTENESLKLSYGKRINRPRLGQLNPFIDITDALNPHSGNPNLKPEIIHALEFGYNKEWNNISLSNNLFYRYAINTIRPYFQLQPNGVNLSLPVNIGNATTYGLENVLNMKLNPKYDVNASLALFEQKIDGSNIVTDAVQDAFGWNAKLINNIIPFKNGKLQIVGNYNSSLLTPQGKRFEQYFIDLGYQQKLGKNTRLGLTIVDVFNTTKSGFSNNTAEFASYRSNKADTRAIMLTFAHTFKTAFKEKLLDNQFSKEY